jgi:sugar lactone lactonase YvrE
MSLGGCSSPTGAGGSGGSGGDGGAGAWGSSSSSGSTDLPDVVHYVEGVEVTTVAGSDLAGDADGAAATFHNPVNVLVDADGGVVVADFDNGRLRRIDSAGIVATVPSGPGFMRPFGLTRMLQGDLIVETDRDEAGAEFAGSLWRIDLAAGAAAMVATNVGRPRGLATRSDGKIVLSDILRHDIRLYDPATSSITPLAGMEGEAGFADDTGSKARFNRPYGVVVTANGDILVADQQNHRIRRITPDGTVSTLAGGAPDMIDGDLTVARFNSPQALAIDAAGNVYVSDPGNHRIRRISASGEVETLAGDGVKGYAEGAGSAASFFGQEGLAVSADGKALFVADGTGGEAEPYNRVRRLALP